MTYPPPPGRRFDDEEVALILRRASELQEAQAAPGGRGDGLTLADLEQVAREAGLDPELVRRAAAEVGESGSAGDATLAGGSAFLGAPTVLRVERVVDGELAPAEFEALLDEIRRTFNDVGSFSTLGRTLAWRSSPGSYGRHGGGGRQLNVTVVVRGGKTGIRVEEATTQLAGALFGGLMGGLGGGGAGIAVGVGLAALHSGPAAAGIWAALVAGSYGLARTIFVALSRRRARALTTLADRLAEYAASAVTRAPAEPRRLAEP